MCTIDLDNLGVQKMYKYDGGYKRPGWISVSDSLKYNYDENLHTITVFDSNKFSIMFVPYTVGKYEDEDMYKIEFNDGVVTINFRANKYCDKTLSWRKIKTISLK